MAGFQVTPGPYLNAMQLGRQHAMQDREQQQKNRLLQQRQKIGSQLAGGNYGAGAQTAFSEGNLELGMGLQQAQQQRQQRARQRALEQQERARKQVGRMASYVKGIQDPQQRQRYAERLFNAHPKFRAKLDEYGVDLSDPEAGLGFLMAEAGIEPQKQPDMPSAVREYQFAMQQRQQRGEPPIPYGEWKKSSKAPLVNVGKGESEYDKTRGEALANEYGTILEDARKARSRIGQLRQIDSLLSDPAVYTGTGAQAINAIKRAGQTLFGMDLEGVDKADAARRVTNEMALSFKSDLPGPMSDSDRQFLTEIPPNIGDTAQGRKLLVELMTAKERRKIELAKMAREYRQRNGRLDDNWYDIAARYAEQNPMFDEEMMERAKEVAGTAQQRSPYAGSYPSVESAEDWEALEPGSYYFDPNGRLKQKKAR